MTHAIAWLHSCATGENKVYKITHDWIECLIDWNQWNFSEFKQPSLNSFIISQMITSLFTGSPAANVERVCINYLKLLKCWIKRIEHSVKCECFEEIKSKYLQEYLRQHFSHSAKSIFWFFSVGINLWWVTNFRNVLFHLLENSKFPRPFHKLDILSNPQYWEIDISVVLVVLSYVDVLITLKILSRVNH